MKVLMTASVYSHIRNFHLPYLREFQRLGWETHVGCRGIPQDAPYIERPIELPFEKKMAAEGNFRAAQILRQTIKAEQYDLIITHTSLASFFTRLAVKGLRNRPRLINVMHGYLFDEHTPFLKKQLLLNAERLTEPETDLLLVMNEWDYRAAIQYRLCKQIAKIPGMGVDFSKLDAATPEDGKRLREKLDIPANAYVLLYPAELSERKNQHVLIEAMQYLPESVRLVLCGEGDQLPACKALARRLHVQDRILFPGQVTDIAAWYRMADALVASSRSEGLPFNVMEAMYCGLPVIASAVKGHTDLIEDGASGLLYPYGDAKMCAECVMRIKEDSILRQNLGATAGMAAKQYALNNVFPQTFEIYLALNKKNATTGVLVWMN